MKLIHIAGFSVLGSIVIGSGLIYVAWHFISKWW